MIIRRAVYDDIPAIMEFIDKHWKKDHILARDRDFFEWQFYENGQVNFYIGIQEETKKIYGIQGFIMYNKEETPDISGSIWKTIKSENYMLGLDLQQFLHQDLNVRYSFSPGIGKKAKRIFELQNMTTTQMVHFYRLNDMNEYKIAKVTDAYIPKIEYRNCKMKRITKFEEFKAIISQEMLMAEVIYKDYTYIEKRYFKHPIYEYDVWAVPNQEGNFVSVLVTRVERVGDAKCCKIIDFFGHSENLLYITESLDLYMKQENLEFVDIYSYGVSIEIYQHAGFRDCSENVNIIPNYFNPYECSNVDIWMVEPSFGGLRMFRGDGDQDRPC